MKKILMGGFGGQGIQVMGRVLAFSAVTEGKNSCWVPSYGPEKRGGTTDCSVIISDGDIPSPLVSIADYVVVLNDVAFEKFKNSVAPGGCMIVNSSLISAKIERDDIKVHYIPLNKIAIELGSEKIVNMLSLGALLKLSECVSKESVLKVLQDSLGQKEANLAKLNQESIEKGIAVASA